VSGIGEVNIAADVASKKVGNGGLLGAVVEWGALHLSISEAI
jgi:hypothetical protein